MPKALKREKKTRIEEETQKEKTSSRARKSIMYIIHIFQKLWLRKNEKKKKMCKLTVVFVVIVEENVIDNAVGWIAAVMFVIRVH